MRFNILIGGKAGQGANVLALLVGRALVKQGYYVFMSREYQSLIRGGHNFNVLTFSDNEVRSNDSKFDILVCLDENTKKIHKRNLSKSGIVLNSSQGTMFFAGSLFKVLGLDFNLLENELRNLRNFDENIKSAKEGYNAEKRKIDIPKVENPGREFISGTQGISKGALESGLDLYFAYPMTPATPLLSELAENQFNHNFLVFEPENEISAINMALGAAITGAKSMTGTSGGGFDLMTEALSMSGQAEIPIVVYLASRPGPSTGLATCTGQGDLQLARHSGHGEFFRLVVAPGDSVEASELTSECFYFSQKYKIPSILLGDKHLAESFYTINEKPKITKSEKTTSLMRYNSYEHTKTGESTEDAEIIKKNFDARKEKQEKIEKDAERFKMFKIFGRRDSKNLVIGWGSTKGAILDAINGLDARFLQVLYIEPFSRRIKSELEKAEKIIIIENSATGMIADLIREKTGILIESKNKILKYDGMPFLADELKKEIQKRI